jgi:uncharacterized membrane protein YgdD (TMEM256/DUF423 family)
MLLMEKISPKLFVILGAIFGAIAILAGAFGAHGLRHTLDAIGLETWQTAARYQLSHAPMLIIIGLALQLDSLEINRFSLKLSGILLAIGVILFSGSLYALTFIPGNGLGLLTPLGGLSLILGWFLLLIAVVKPNDSRQLDP